MSRSHRTLVRLVSLALGTALALAGSSADAKPRRVRSVPAAQPAESAAARTKIVLVGVTGPQAAAAADAISEVLGREHELVAQADVTAAKKRLRVRKLTKRKVMDLAEGLGAHAVVEGKVKKRGRVVTLALTVRDGADGSVLAELSIAVPKGRFKGAFLTGLAADLLPAVADARGPESANAAETEVAAVDAVEQEQEVDTEALPEAAAEDDLDGGGGGDGLAGVEREAPA